MEFDAWVKLLYIDHEIPLRGGNSKHQRKVMEILGKVEARDRDGLLSTRLIGCTGETEIVGYCRYLQYLIGILKNEGQKDD